jgi:hypothetical protein
MRRVLAIEFSQSRLDEHREAVEKMEALKTCLDLGAGVFSVPDYRERAFLSSSSFRIIYWLPFMAERAVHG